MEWIEEIGGYISSVVSSVSGLISAATYVLVAISLFTIAKRREIPNPWMAFVPILQMWTLGAVSDDYQQKVWGTVRTRRKTLLGLQIAISSMGFVLAIMIIAAVVALLSAGYTGYDDIWDWIGVNGSFGGIIAVLIAWCVIGILVKIWRYIALFDVYRSCKPEQAVLFLLLNIFVAITEPIFLLLACRSDEGMTPVAGPAEPWEME